MADARFTLIHLDSGRGLRGAERQLLYLADEMRRRGHHNVIVCRAGELLDQEAIRQGFYRVHIPFLADWDPISAWQLRKKLAAFSNPILHAHTEEVAGVATMTAEGAGIPRVIHRRTDLASVEALDFLMKYRRANKVIAVSDSVRQKFVDAGLAPEKIVTIYEGYPATLVRKGPREPQDVEAARRDYANEFDVPATSIWIGTASSLTPLRDHSSSLKALPEILHYFPETFLLIAGEGPTFNQLRQEAGELGVLGRVRFLGTVRDQTSFISTLDVFIFPPLTMGLGFDLLEAMAQGVPLVTTWVGGVTELVEHGVNGLFVSPKDPAKIAASVRSILEKPVMARGLVQKGFERVRGFSTEAMADRTEAVYREIAKG